jgi:hypothetical protein
MISISINDQHQHEESMISISTSINDQYQHQQSASASAMISISINDQHQHQQSASVSIMNISMITKWGHKQLGTRSHREAGPSDEPSNGTFQQWGIEQLSTHSYREAGPTTSYPM